ncbi:PREDICTED: platelet glycoprotein Ib alpha chain [Thamnophis sirtalis]|uniref:Platelet glycoprotein Ib alpha chain n=1 Tax=Thamnophis sirtalis TaxID=35019 RepID=A0A6I9Z179_9SAUR|nr:PREDICTED: platelet glycoprotein Ib alpha chain [Thamnophis sirtalis]
MNNIEDLLQVSCVEKGLTNIPGGLPEDTGILLLASNQLAKVALASFQHLPLLWKLDLSNNSLKVLETGATLPKLEKLLLSHNSLESLPAFLGLPNLKRLALGHNRLSQLPEGAFRGLGRLQDLELQGNQLQSLPVGVFHGLQVLGDLDLSDNRLEALPPQLLDKLEKLAILGLERNRLERVPQNFFPDNEYAYVHLVENPWLCDCRLDYLREWIKDNEIFVYTRMNVQEEGMDKEVMENEPEKVLCHGPPQVKGQAVMNFTTVCRKLGDEDPEVEVEGGPAEDSWSPSLTPPPSTPTASRRSSPSPSTAVSPSGAALTTTSGTPALSSMTTHCPTTSSPGPTTALRPLTTTAAFAAFGLSTSAATAGKSRATSNGPMTTPGPSTAHTPTSGVPTTMATSSNPPALSPTASMLTTPLPSSAPPPATTAAGHPPSTAALVPPTPTPTHVQSSARISAPLSTRGFSAPKASAHCLCPILPVRVLGVAAHQGSKAEWLAGSCCLLRLVLYLACLALVALPTLALLCWLGWLSLGWDRPAVRGAPGSCLAQTQQWQEASPKGWQLKLAEAPPRRTSGPRIYRVCKTFQVGPSRHVSWLLVSLPGSAGKWARMQARLSSYSLDRGKDTLGAVRVKYAAASL